MTTTDMGLAYALQRLSDAPDLDALERVWDALGNFYKRDPKVAEHKDRLKLEFQKEAQKRRRRK